MPKLAVSHVFTAFSEVKHLTDEQKDLISGLSAPSQLDVQEICFFIAYHPNQHVLNVSCAPHKYLEERRCLYAAMDRRFNQGGRLVICFQLVPKHMPISSQNTLKPCVSRSACRLDGKVFSGSWKPQQEARGLMKPKNMFSF